MRHQPTNGPYGRRPSWDGFFTNSVVNKIILANVVVFALEYLLRGDFISLFALTPRMMFSKFYFWQPITYMFLHAGFMHLFFNMLMLWFLGSALERVWGGQRFLKYYLWTGVGGAVFSIILTFNVTVVGASAAVFGLYLAYAMIYPNNYVYIYFLFPVKAKYLVAFLTIFQLVQGVAGPTGIAYFAHLGGIAFGLFFFKDQIKNSAMLSRTRRRVTDGQRERRDNNGEQELTKIDSILDKIHSKGYENLSATEKRILENYSRQRKDDSE